MKVDHCKKIHIGHLNINSIRNKFDSIMDIVGGQQDIFLISETKIDSSFPDSQFTKSGYSKPFRRDRTANGGGLLLFVNEDIPAHELSNHNLPDDIEVICTEVNLRKQKWLIISIYHPPNQDDHYFLEELSKLVDKYSNNYDNFVIMGDFNLEIDNDNIENFLQAYDLHSLIREPTCFKSSPPKCIDLILTNRKHNFIHSTTIETGLSDFHKLTSTILKTEYIKGEPQIVTYRNSKNFNAIQFNNDLRDEMQQINNPSYNSFSDIFARVLNSHAPLKKKAVRANDAPFMTKELRKCNMERSMAKNKFNKYRTQETWQSYKVLRNRSVKLLRSTKKKYFRNLDIKIVSDCKNFWKVIKPVFTSKCNTHNKIILVEEDTLIKDTKDVAKIMNDYFTDITETLNIPKYIPNESEEILPPNSSIAHIIEYYKDHPSILRIKQKCQEIAEFSFKSVKATVIKDEIASLKTNKATGPDNIPAKILKTAIDEIYNLLTYLFNVTVATCTFPSEMKQADITPIFKKDNSTKKKNYRPISVLPSTSKIFERIMYKQIYNHMKSILSPLLCGFREGYSTQHALLRLVEDLKAALDEKLIAGTVMMDLSKAFDCLPHDLLIAKLHAYGFSDNALKLLYDYLQGRVQRVKLNSNYSEWRDVIKGVPQGSVLGPLLFNIFLNDIFLFLDKSEICNYADDNTIWTKGQKINTIIPILESEISTLNKWFKDNCMLLNEEKCKYIIIEPQRTKSGESEIRIGDHSVKNTDKETLLGVVLDNHLKFDHHIKKICNEAGKKISALARIAPYLGTDKRKLLMKTFITTYFNYCPIVWMFCSRKMNNLINNVHKRALRVAYNDYDSTFEVLLSKDHATTIHQQNLQRLAIEMYKTKINQNPNFLNDIFKFHQSSYDLRNEAYSSKKPNTVIYGTETVSYRCSQIWNNLPIEVRNANNLEIFKRQIKQITIPCSCKLCTQYIPNLGYIT